MSERRVCRVLGQHRSTQRRVPAGRDDEERLIADVTELARQYGRYGYRRIALALGHAGEVVNHKTVQRLMQGLGLKSLVRTKKYRSYRGQLAAAPNLLDRQFEASGPNQKWVTDVTEFNVRGDKLYLSPVMDLYNGEIVAYEMLGRPIFALVGLLPGLVIYTVSYQFVSRSIEIWFDVKVATALDCVFSDGLKKAAKFSPI